MPPSGFARLGLSTAIAAHVGNDQIGHTMQAALAHEGVDTHLVRFDPKQPSNRNFVLWFGPDRTILVRHQLFDYHWAHLSPREVPRWLYLSSVGSDAPEYYDQIVAWLDAEPSVRFAFQPGTFQIAQGAEAMRDLYRAGQPADLQQGGGGRDRRRGPRPGGRPPRLAAPARPGDRRRHGRSGRGLRVGRVAALPGSRLPRSRPRPKERTGAGDAFSSALVAALVKGLPLEAALSWAPVERHERGPRGRLPIRAAQREPAAQVPRRRPGASYAVTAW